MGRLFVTFLEVPNVYRCKCCKLDISSKDHIVWDGVMGRNKPAFLFDSVVNVDLGESYEEVLSSGMFELRNVTCKVCAVVLGWKYERASSESQKYKEGKYILEQSLLELVVDVNTDTSLIVPLLWTTGH